MIENIHSYPVRQIPQTGSQRSPASCLISHSWQVAGQRQKFSTWMLSHFAASVHMEMILKMIFPLMFLRISLKTSQTFFLRDISTVKVHFSLLVSSNSWAFILLAVLKSCKNNIQLSLQLLRSELGLGAVTRDVELGIETVIQNNFLLRSSLVPQRSKVN